MSEPTIRECATPDCTNTWEVQDEDDQRKTCGLCEIEVQAQTPIPTAGSEEFGRMERRHLSMAMKLALRRMDKDERQRRKPSSPHADPLDTKLNPEKGEQNDPPDKCPKEVMETDRDLADHLDGRKTPPEADRDDTPHTRKTGT